MYKPISCDNYDYLEICCMRQYQILLELKDERFLHVRPVTLHARPDKTEWLEVEHTDGNVEEIRLDQLAALTPDAGCKAEFGRVSF